MQTLPDGTALDRFGPEHGPTAVLIHGLGLNRACWQWTVPALTGAGFQVIAYDLYGHGGSGPAPEPPSLGLFSRQLAGVLDHRGLDRAAIAGFSLGGMIARRFAQDHPERTAALAILFSPHKRTAKAQAAIVQRVARARDAGPAATVEAALERWFTAPYRMANPARMELVRAWVLANDAAVYHRFYQVLAEGIDEIVAPRPPIACPTLVMTGDEDYGNGPQMSQAISAEIAGSELHILKGLRHMALAEAPEAVNAPLTVFLTRAMMKQTAR